VDRFRIVFEHILLVDPARLPRKHVSKSLTPRTCTLHLTRSLTTFTEVGNGYCEEEDNEESIQEEEGHQEEGLEEEGLQEALVACLVKLLASFVVKRQPNSWLPFFFVASGGQPNSTAALFLFSVRAAAQLSAALFVFSVRVAVHFSAAFFLRERPPRGHGPP
jgi:hypothetical protein